MTSLRLAKQTSISFILEIWHNNVYGSQMVMIITLVCVSNPMMSDNMFLHLSFSDIRSAEINTIHTDARSRLTLRAAISIFYGWTTVNCITVYKSGILC